MENLFHNEYQKVDSLICINAKHYTSKEFNELKKFFLLKFTHE